ncbi:polyphosphate polymerase domain-containing protein [Shewanella saliphila]|uniref:VTC domain-containing protein n=1 Tax=Shewanella saliphila TaxID=2282698 RepID=A0ABQ2Q9T2_9GAMM|nr:polyphosphate polymerase domain-containing protein [Shewanella saliphila]MCL1103071.1 polyphosphate polymerase domain-containing protein [Shewanella saliphila]GGP60013.1 VTC domain-containing protein [Shewanella saliphila]
MNIISPHIEQLLSTFDSHNLDDLQHANLQNRVDSKFILPLAFLPHLLEAARHHYSVLEINGKRTSNYFNQYFDTQEMSFYKDHHNGKLNRFKVRKRTYLDTKTQYLEVKFKNNHKRTIKSRIRCNENVHLDDNNHSFIQQHLGYDLTQLSVSQQGGYQRIALANEALPERLTIDFNLWYQSSAGEERIDLNGFFIVELKQQKHSKRSPFYQLLPQHYFTPTPFSKYCIGCVLLRQQAIKYNRFKPILMKLSSLNQSNQHTALWNH